MNHGWNPPALLLSQTIAGISPDSPGWVTYHVLPKEAFITSIQTVVPTIKVNVKVDLHKTATEYSISLESPSKTAAIVGIPKGSFTALNKIEVNGVTLWDGQYRGGVPGIEWDGDDGNYIKFKAISGRWKFVGFGVLPLNSPKPAPSPAPCEQPLTKKNWAASSSVPDSTFLFSGDKIPIDGSAANALDGDHWTGWRDMTGTQHPGQWFQVDMRQKQTFHKIVLDNTWALWDSPDQFSVTVSDDGLNWSSSVATGAGQMGITAITFPVQTARYVRITQTGTSALYHWSIYELDVF